MKNMKDVLQLKIKELFNKSEYKQGVVYYTVWTITLLRTRNSLKQ